MTTSHCIMFPLIILNLSAFSTDPQFIEVVPIYIANIYCKKKTKKTKKTNIKIKRWDTTTKKELIEADNKGVGKLSNSRHLVFLLRNRNILVTASCTVSCFLANWGNTRFLYSHLSQILKSETILFQKILSARTATKTEATQNKKDLLKH